MPTQMSLDEFKEDAVQSAGHLSHSHVSSYIRCPMVTYWRYEKNVKAPPASAMSFGSCTHKALEHNFNQKVYSKQDVPVSVVTDVFRDAWKEAAPQTKTVFGGVHVSALGGTLLSSFPNIDYLAPGEGEVTLLELASGRDAASIDGLIWRDGE